MGKNDYFKTKIQHKNIQNSNGKKNRQQKLNKKKNFFSFRKKQKKSVSNLLNYTKNLQKNLKKIEEVF